MRFPSDTFLQSVEVPLNSSPALQHIDCSPHLTSSAKLSVRSILFCKAVKKGVEYHRFQNQALRNTTSCQLDFVHHPVSLVVAQPSSHLILHLPSTRHQLGLTDTVRKCIEGLARVNAYNIHSTPPVHATGQPGRFAPSPSHDGAEATWDPSWKRLWHLCFPSPQEPLPFKMAVRSLPMTSARSLSPLDVPWLLPQTHARTITLRFCATKVHETKSLFVNHHPLLQQAISQDFTLILPLTTSPAQAIPV